MKGNKFDNVSINPDIRPNDAMQIINIDIIDPIEPASGCYKYILCALDQCTLWLDAVCLINISAKSTCIAQIPKLIGSDRGNIFT